jgi:subtilisin-like proprotein convertase family protein
LPLAAALVLLCGAAPAPRGFGASGTLKIRVPDSQLKAMAGQEGSRLVADYGSFAVFEAPASRAASVAASVAGAEVLNDENKILLNAGALDTTTPEVKALSQPVGEFAGKNMLLVQFAGPVRPEWYAQMTGAGAAVVTYIPTNAYLLYGDAKQIAATQAWGQVASFVQWQGAYRDEYRIDPKAAAMMNDPAHANDQRQLFSIQLVKDAATNAQTLGLISKLAGGPTFSEYEVLNYHNIVVPIAPAQLAQVAARGDVVSIQVYVVPTMADERQDQIVSGALSGGQPTGPGYLAWLQSKGFTQAQFDASGFVVDVSDSGIDNATTSPNHFGLYAGGVRPGTSRIMYNRLEGTAHSPSTLQGCDGHGTLNTHIVLGWDDSSGFPFADTLGYHYGLGMCPWTRAGSSVIFDPQAYTAPNFPMLQSSAYHDGARLSTNSWGALVGGAYNADAQAYDALVRDAQPSGSMFPADGNQEMVIVFAAHNGGPGAGSIGAPGSAKNVLTCGAAENVQPFGGPDGCGEDDTLADNANDIATFSSRGPCQDQRVKPDICAPGTHVSGGVFQVASPGPTGTADPCFNGVQVCGGPSSSHFWPTTQQFYSASSGTSHSTPCVAGACALLRQYFINLGMAPPSPAMTKAFIMNSARYMNGAGANDSLYSNNQGMGELDLSQVFGRSQVNTVLRDENPLDLFTATGQTRVFTGSIIDSTQPFRATLVWTDAPGPTSGNAYVNNLDLTVSAGGNTYHGNVFTGANSVTGGSADARNNAESVFLPAGVSGAFTVTVTAANIAADGVPGNGSALDQDFALVIYNGSSAPIAILNGTGANTFSDAIGVGNGNGNGRIDPGESSIRVNVPIANNGNIPATGVTGTLVSNTPTVSVTTAASAYADLSPAGGTATNATPYVISVSPSHPCTAPISLTLNIHSTQADAAYNFSFPTGLPGGGGPFTISYTGPAVAIPDGNPTTGATVSVPVSGLPGSISDLNVRFDGSSCSATQGATTVGLDHSWVGDLTVFLTSPSGTMVTLMNRPGGVNNSGNNFCQTTLDDQATSPIQTIMSTGAPWTGSFTPASPLSGFNGQSPNGVWQLRVTDSVSGDIGNIRAFSLIFTTVGAPDCDPPHSTCGSADFNCDGAFGTDTDIEAFFACIAGTCPPPPCTSTADFDGDTHPGTDADIEAFFRVLSGLPC